MNSDVPRPVILDHNVPRPIVEYLAIEMQLFPDVAFHFTRDLGEHLAEMDDDRLIVEMHRRGFSVFVTADYRMLRSAAVLVAIEQTRMSVLAVRSANHDPLLCTGVLLRDLVPLLKRDHHKGLIFEAHPSQIEPKRSRDRLKDLAVRGQTPEDLIREHATPWNHRTRYSEDDPRRLV